jgi:hypothetical protein
MSPLRLALRYVLLGPRRARLAALLIAAGLCAVDLFAGHLAGQRARLEYQAVVTEGRGHLALLPQGASGFDSPDRGRIERIAEQVPGVALVAPRAGRMAVYLSDPAKLDSRREALARAFERAAMAVQVVGWRESAPEVAREERILDLEFTCAVAVALVLAWATLASTLAIGTLERRRELAILRALGMRRRRVFVLLTAEAVWMAMAAGALSLSASSLIAWIANRVALSIATAPSLVPPPLMVELDPGRVLAGAGAVLGMALLAAFLPALKAARADPVRGLATL